MGLKSFFIPACLILFAALILSARLAYADTKIDLKPVTHPIAGFAEQDVFVLQNGQAMRLDAKEVTSSANLSKSAYSSLNATDHDPFKLSPNPLGPFPLGKALGFTVGQWLEATGSGTYSVNGDSAHISLIFHKLVPGSTYTVWCSRLTFPPNFRVVDKPCGAQDGSENVFKSDSIGEGGFSLTLKPLEESTRETATVIAIAYHSDGKSSGSKPGDFGSNTHVQLFVPIPAITEAAAKETIALSSSAPQASPSLITSKKFWGGIVGVIVILVLALVWVGRKAPTKPEES